MKEVSNLMQLKQTSDINSISNLPKIPKLLLQEGYELLPNTSELFELEFAYYESKLLSDNDIIKRGALRIEEGLFCGLQTP